MKPNLIQFVVCRVCFIVNISTVSGLFYIFCENQNIYKLFQEK